MSLTLFPNFTPTPPHHPSHLQRTTRLSIYSSPNSMSIDGSAFAPGVTMESISRLSSLLETGEDYNQNTKQLCSLIADDMAQLAT